MPTPMIDDIELHAVQWIRQESDNDFAGQRVVGLAGTHHQQLGRRSHRVHLAGLLLPESAADDLAALQQKVAAGGEVGFTADISSALEIQKMLIESWVVEQTVGPSGQYAYRLTLTESPPLPPPAEVSAFGGLDGFGDDLGFDVDALADVAAGIAAQADAVMAAVDAAVDAVQQVAALASLADLGSLGNPVKPVIEKLADVEAIGDRLGGLSEALAGVLP
ncbi:MAG TPA: hypothetical protein PK981_06225 [Accumulibacter sp.]|nr:hypothetical protein [Accumulibacter sp.]HMX23235.1 hypothetical protein [Accumulibacter sp.]HNG38625.1 hypothetical protein [Accumulibacter sp.]HNL13856.1 hypothetical protein [Accumulibacter sp.]